MRLVRFTTPQKSQAIGANTLRVVTPLGAVEITIGLHDDAGRPVVRIETTPNEADRTLMLTANRNPFAGEQSFDCNGVMRLVYLGAK